MLEVFREIEGECRLRVESGSELPIAIVGAGTITNGAHIPAYQEAGLHIAGIFDRDEARANECASAHRLPRVYPSWRSLLEDPSVAIVDIAVAPLEQPALIRDALNHGKHVLCQKPFVDDLHEGVELVRMADSQGLKVAVNQQLRYEEALAAARAMVNRGWIGDVTTVTFTVNVMGEWSPWPWLMESPRMEVLFHSIHYFDAIRALLGNPEYVFSTGTRTPGQTVRGETRSITCLGYPGDVRALVHSAHENRAGDFEARFRIEGSDGAIRGTIGLMYGYPKGERSQLEVFSSVIGSDGWLPYPVTSRWIPDAFLGPMASLMGAIATGGEPLPSGADNLDTIRLVKAIYQSMESVSVVPFPATTNDV
jgi:predicted dehydrogenase